MERRKRSEYYDFIKISDRVWHINSQESVCMFLFVGDSKALLLDTGYGYGDLKGQIEQITQLPLIVVNSHGHLDHANGNFQFGNIYIHERDMELCREHNSGEKRRESVGRAKELQDFVTREVSNILPLDFEEEDYINQGCGQLKATQEGELFELGNLTLKVIELPGHTSGSIGLHYAEENWLYVSDAMNPFVWLFMPEALKLDDYKKTLYKAKALNSSMIITGHNPELLPAAVIDDYIFSAEHLDYERGVDFRTPLAAEAKARICLPEGYTLEDMGKPGCAAIVINEEHL